MKPLFIKKNGTVSKVSGIIMNLIPSYTMAEYNALTHKPLLWVRTDEDYAQIPSEDVSYGSGSVKDALDGAKIFYKDIPIAGLQLSNYYINVSTGVNPNEYTAIGMSDVAGAWDENLIFRINTENTLRVLSMRTATYTVPNIYKPIRVYFVKNSRINPTPLS